MAKKSASGAKRPARGVPGASGGPGTGRGLNYQTRYAVMKSLDLISRSLVVPHKNWAIRIEPRAGSDSSATSWDVGFDPARELIEAKSNPTRPDVLDWLDRIAVAAADGSVKFTLVY